MSCFHPFRKSDTSERFPVWNGFSIPGRTSGRPSSSPILSSRLRLPGFVAPDNQPCVWGAYLKQNNRTEIAPL
ncbi:unnamed protein product [Larinioides sclopetarius]|uniref:Uncharacterized protein n=1 Tax=Larinioides sclopetarius TaxID=280406 RepID=A0AAV2AHK0_9ARAC